MSHHVYRIYDAADRLIYIGATSNLAERIKGHLYVKDDGPHCHPVLSVGRRMARYTAEEFPTRAEAFAAEREAIRAERPELNTRGVEMLETDYTLEEVAEALRMSTRWIRERIKDGKEGRGPTIAHERRGHKIVFTGEQVELLRNQFTEGASPVGESITTGRKKRAS